MKNLSKISLLFLFLFSMACTSETSSPEPIKPLAFIGSYTQKEGHVDGKGAGVSIYETGPKAADWKLLGTFSNIINPSYICLSPKHPIVYAVSEQGPNVPEPKSVIKVIQYDTESFAMKELQSISAEGHAPCYISTDDDGQFLLVANYVSGNVVQYIIKADGTLSPGISSQHTGIGPHPRQEAPHAHFIHQHPKDNEIYAVDLGIDLVLKYKAGESGLTLLDSIRTEAGMGPRHLSWHPNGNIMYVLGELNGTIEAWKLDASKSQRIQAISLKSGGDERPTGAADIHTSSDGRFVYASLRGDFNNLAVFSIDPKSFELEFLQRVSLGGEAPRNFSISPDENYLAVALQNSDRIVLLERDKVSGILSGPSETVEVMTPVCVVYK